MHFLTHMKIKNFIPCDVWFIDISWNYELILGFDGVSRSLQ